MKKNIDSEGLTDFNIKTLSQYIEANPEIGKITLSRIIRHGIDNLRHYIVDPQEKEIIPSSPPHSSLSFCLFSQIVLAYFY